MGNAQGWENAGKIAGSVNALTQSGAGLYSAFKSNTPSSGNIFSINGSGMGGVGLGERGGARLQGAPLNPQKLVADIGQAQALKSQGAPANTHFDRLRQILGVYTG